MPLGFHARLLRMQLLTDPLRASSSGQRVELRPSVVCCCWLHARFLARPLACSRRSSSCALMHHMCTGVSLEQAIVQKVVACPRKHNKTLVRFNKQTSVCSMRLKLQCTMYDLETDFLSYEKAHLFAAFTVYVPFKFV